MLPRSKIVIIFLAAACLAAPYTSFADTITSKFQVGAIHELPLQMHKPVGKRISYWAEAFVGTPYDTDSLGRYVREERIVADDAVDCMYLTFRAVELALSRTPEEAIEKALDLRFQNRGKLDGERVVNYDDRFQYGEDMIDSGKWGKEITSNLGRTVRIKGSRGRDEVVIIPKDELTMITNLDIGGESTPLRDGDIIFFIKAPNKRVVGEIVGHIGIISIKAGVPYLVHASGQKDSADSKGAGRVKSVRLWEYAENMRFVGVRVTRFQ
ncbi:MAG: hypothetical protein Q7T53_01240 [Deltaproteobacteria bacterium]|nr:hypothetical protein [Deltaproteobacteria bacterium]